MDASQYQQHVFDLPFPSNQHPRAAEAQDHTREWAQSHGLLRGAHALSRFDALGYGRLMAYACPTAPFEQLLLIVDWNTLFFMADDLQSEAVASQRTAEYERLRHAALDVINSKGERDVLDHPVLTGLTDLCRRTFPGRSTQWSGRFSLDLERWLTGHARENAYRSAGVTPDPEQYTQLRRDASTVFPTLDLMEVAEHVEIPPPLYYASDYQALVTSTADIMCWINDVHSLSVETAGGDAINLIVVLHEHRGLTYEAAAAEVVRMIGERVAAHQAAAEAFVRALDTEDPTAAAIGRVVRDQGSWAAGMERWDRLDTVRHQIASLSTGEMLRQ
ncbi:hypothetical protein AB0K81_31760 [Streptomyces werraensis]|uniref:Terpene synthase n=1 Tax=Streptomyces werraensis TaxID=68284 RepID=A0ABV3JNT8_9ACTN